MSAVLESRALAQACLPLLHADDESRIVAWRGRQAVDAGTFLADVAAIAATLPERSHAINLCEDRYAFLASFCAVASRGQTTLLPAARTPAAIAETLAAYAGSYALSDTEAHGEAPLRIPALGQHGRCTHRPAFEAAHAVAIGFTSGSTGAPRAHAKTWASFHASSAANARSLLAALAPATHAHVVATVPPQHMYGMELSVLLPLLGPFAIHDSRPLFPADVADALAQIDAPRVLVTTPVHLRALLRESLALPPLAAIVSATAPLSRELAAAAEAHLGAPLLEMFGSTETCVIAQRRTAIEDSWQLYDGIALRPQPDGTLVDAPHLHAPVALADLVELLPEGRFRLCGRHADLLDIAGKRASLAELTRRVLALPGVLDAALFQLDDGDAAGVRRLAALVVAPTRSEADLLDALRLCFDPVFLPRPLRKVDHLPRNATGKLPRAALLAQLADCSA